jgi:hypothetical protein
VPDVREGERVSSHYEFRVAAIRQERCAVPSCRLLVLDRGHAHHAIPEQSLRDLFPDRPELVWDVRNALLLCTQHHARHHLRFELIPRDGLPADVDDFAGELGITWLLEKLYTRPAPVVDRTPA